MPQTGESWFAATVEVDAAALEHHPEIQLKAGMPAELFVTTSESHPVRIPREADHGLHEPRTARTVISPKDWRFS